ncbi:hypothetical protein P691DRAFT_665106 [Macrolepiota fuliginosa MF-IS2]|uniref:Uncharacterized protein n=1 Tax=Macrolepiota fuliginosa MF-IS2 TaxID=1400762 RepID=A0A9P5XFR2_9AGAR|nr:hypothetical protein P691DRAFT_665106 [Macrolepiota fuliginosa MF-IS2]
MTSSEDSEVLPVQSGTTPTSSLGRIYQLSFPHASIHIGFAIEDERTVYLSIGWETLQHNKVFARSPENANLRPSLRPFLSGPLAIQHIHPSADPTNAFSAPLTEFASFALKKGQSREELHVLLKKMCVIIDQASSPKHAPCALGESLEYPGTFHLIVGWDTVAVSNMFIKSGLYVSRGPLPPRIISRCSTRRKQHL